MKTIRSSFGYSLETEVEASPDRVWTLLADYGRDAEWRADVTMRSDPPGVAREGTRTFETIRAFGSRYEKTAVIDQVDPGRSLRFRGEDGSFEGTRAVEPAGKGSRIRVTLRVEVTGLLALFAPVLGWLFRLRVKRDLARLRGCVEAPSAGGASLARST